jgi:hypothetical protein
MSPGVGLALRRGHWRDLPQEVSATEQLSAALLRCRKRSNYRCRPRFSPRNLLQGLPGATRSPPAVNLRLQGLLARYRLLFVRAASKLHGEPPSRLRCNQSLPVI